MCKLWTLGIGVLCEREQLAIIHRGLVAIARGFCRVRGPIVAPEPVRFALLGWLAPLVWSAIAGPS